MGAKAQCSPLTTLLSLRLGLQRSLMVDFQKKGLDEKKVFVVRDEAPYFSEVLGFSLPSPLVNPAQCRCDKYKLFEGNGLPVTR